MSKNSHPSLLHAPLQRHRQRLARDLPKTLHLAVPLVLGQLSAIGICSHIWSARIRAHSSNCCGSACRWA
jgi:hypothetical protein